MVSVATSPTWSTVTNNHRTEYASGAVAGYSLESLWFFRYAGLNEQGRAQFWSAIPENVAVDENNQEDYLVLRGMTDLEGLEYSGSMVPTMQGGFTNTFTYKNLSLQTLLVGSFGNKIRLRNLSSQSSAFGYPDPTQNLSAE
ncbi:MAG: hypothetical protein LUD68_05135 [Rikenellaceae bacterium]|nr:hypothetical protein [Rikenellaceae bacterium]